MKTRSLIHPFLLTMICWGYDGGCQFLYDTSFKITSPIKILWFTIQEPLTPNDN